MKTVGNEEESTARTEEFFLFMLNHNNIIKLPEFLHNDVIFPTGKGKINCLKWIQMELDKISVFRLKNGGLINGKEWNPHFDETGETLEYFISTGQNAGARAIPIQDFAFPFVKDNEPPHAITLSVEFGLIKKIEVTYLFVGYKKFIQQLSSN